VRDGSTDELASQLKAGGGSWGKTRTATLESDQSKRVQVYEKMAAARRERPAAHFIAELVVIDQLAGSS
jgi:hypothetical protein